MRQRWFMILCLLLMACQGQKAEKVEDAKLEFEQGYALSENDTSALDFSTDEEKPSPTQVGELEIKLRNAGLVDIQEIIPEVLVELKYSTTDNFFGKDVYGELENCYMQPEVAQMLKQSYDHLQQSQPALTFLIYDAVRPQSVQQVLWDELDKPESLKPLYVADPQKGSLHNFGVAIDLTLALKDSGEPLDMGTGYDYFGYLAYPDREEQMLNEGKIIQAQVDNRKVLRAVMKAGGFTGIGSEWWHFNAFSRKEAGEKFEIVK